MLFVDVSLYSIVRTPGSCTTSSSQRPEAKDILHSRCLVMRTLQATEDLRGAAHEPVRRFTSRGSLRLVSHAANLCAAWTKPASRVHPGVISQLKQWRLHGAGPRAPASDPRPGESLGLVKISQDVLRYALLLQRRFMRPDISLAPHSLTARGVNCNYCDGDCELSKMSKT